MKWCAQRIEITHFCKMYPYFKLLHLYNTVLYYNGIIVLYSIILDCCILILCNELWMSPCQRVEIRWSFVVTVCFLPLFWYTMYIFRTSLWKLEEFQVLDAVLQFPCSCRNTPWVAVLIHKKNTHPTQLSQGSTVRRYVTVGHYLDITYIQKVYCKTAQYI